MYTNRILSLRIFVILCFVTTYCNGLRILGLFPYPGKSHFVMIEKIMKALAARGHCVDVYGHFPQKNPPSNYTDYSLAGTVPEMTNKVTYEELTQFMVNAASVRHWIRIAGTNICEHMKFPVFQQLLRNPPKDPPYDLIISDVIFASCYIAWSRFLNIPMVDIMTTTPYDWMHEPLGDPWNIAIEPPMFAEHYAPKNFLQRLQNFYTGFRWTYVFNYYIREQDAYVEKYFGPGYPSVLDMHKDLALVLSNYHYSVHGQHSYVPAIVPVAGLHISETREPLDQTLQKWLDDSKDGFVYFSLGSMVRIETFPKDVLAVFYQAFESIAPVRVLWRIVDSRELPSNLPKNIMTQKWLPQIEILKHKNIKAFITHSGMMSTYESIYCAVPVISFPFFIDQYMNADMFVEKKIGLRIILSEITTEKLTTALMEILKNSIYKKNMVKLSEIFKDRPMSPMDTAIFWIEYVGRHGKKALRSTIVDMPWWQSHLLDIYAFIVIILASFIFSFLKILQMLTLLIKSKIKWRKVSKFKIN